MTKPSWELDWEAVAHFYGGEVDLFGKRAISLRNRPHVGRTKDEWQNYVDRLVNLVMLAGRGGAGLKIHVGGMGRGRYLVRD